MWVPSYHETESIWMYGAHDLVFYLYDRRYARDGGVDVPAILWCGFGKSVVRAGCLRLGLARVEAHLPWPPPRTYSRERVTQ